jgi:endoribonuclease Dicer
LVEAYVGAVFIDSGFDMKEIERFFELQILPFFRDITLYDNYAGNQSLVSESFELRTNSFEVDLQTQLAKFSCTGLYLAHQALPEFLEKKRCTVAVVMIHKELFAKGTSLSPHSAKVMACRKAVLRINLEVNEELDTFRKLVGCDCSG